MKHLRDFLAVAAAEVRAARRLARTWVFIVLGALIAVATYLGYAAVHGFGSGFSASVGAFGPRLLIAGIGWFMLIFMVIGLVLLAFDIRARDQRERMAEVLDTRPVGNVVLIGGRLAGSVLLLWLAVAVIMGLVQLIGVTAKAFDWWFGDTIEPVSLLGFLFVDALPSLVLWGSLVALLAVTIRNRLIVAILALGIFGLYVWSGFVLPYYLVRVLSVFQATVGTASDMLPAFAEDGIPLQRVFIVVLAAALVVFAAALHPRQDGRGPRTRLAVASVLAGLAVAGLALLVDDATSARALRADWAALHEAVEGEARHDVLRLEGDVTIDPGRRLALELDYHLEVASPTRELLFSFNPGLSVSEVRVDGTPAASTHEAGLLRIELAEPRAGGERVHLELTAAGYPDESFGYLDSDLDLDLVKGEAANVLLLGTDVIVFDRRYVALMPGGRWLPMPGTATGRGDPAHYGQDYFEIDLVVGVPDGWLVAGPGLRRDAGNGGFRFAPPAPVPEFALLASRFDRRHTEIGGVEFELLLHPGHGTHLGLFADSFDMVKERVGERLADAAAFGFPYPYEGFSLVEVPTRLRVFGGGWRMDAVRAQPGMLMLRETGLPTARFDTLFRILAQFGQLPEGEGEQGAEAAFVKTALLEQFFEGDFSGGKLVDGATRNFLRFQTGARGEGAIALDYVIHELAASLIHRRAVGAYFSPRTFASGANLQDTFFQLLTGMFSGEGLRLTMDTSAPTLASTWSLALGMPLAALDPATDAGHALDVLAFKAPAIARSMVDGLGRDALGALLAELRRRHAGSNFTIDDFNAVARDTGADLDSLVGDWLGDASLPGFLVSNVDAQRLTDGERGEPRYQVRVHVRNGEPTPGLVRLGVFGEADDESRRWSDPVRVGGLASVELGMVVDAPPAEAWLAPYLSLNRRDMRLALGDYDTREAVDAVPFNGSRASDWQPAPEPGIVVDDLDPGFSIVYATPEDEDDYTRQLPTWLGGNVDFDQGLPVYNPTGLPPRGWWRREPPGTWGRYRHTIANAFAGDGGASARFTAQLPSAGRWRVDYYVPSVESREHGSDVGGGFRVQIERGVLTGEKGDYDVKIVATGVEESIEFDASAAREGWNDLGEFSLPAGEASLLVSNKTTGRAVVADAVRWRPVDAR